MQYCYIRTVIVSMLWQVVRDVHGQVVDDTVRKWDIQAAIWLGSHTTSVSGTET